MISSYPSELEMVCNRAADIIATYLAKGNLIN